MSGVDRDDGAGDMQDRSAHVIAATWIIRDAAKSDDRDAALLDRWLADDDANVDAYADTAVVWDELGQILPDWKPDCSISPEAEPEVVSARSRHRSLAVFGIVASLLLSVVGWHWLTGPKSFSTTVGEQRVATLADGSRLTLNTDSEVEVQRFGADRRVRLGHGEVLFDVAHDASRPFLVEAVGHTVRVTGTSFVVRRDGDQIIVTLLKGAVLVERSAVGAVHLKPGDRYRDEPGGNAIVDRPSIDMVTAWRKGEVLLDNTRLQDAVREMNRYTSRPIRLADPALGELTLSGVFKTGETNAFADTLASIYGLRIARDDKGILLARGGSASLR